MTSPNARLRRGARAAITIATALCAILTPRQGRSQARTELQLLPIATRALPDSLIPSIGGASLQLRSVLARADRGIRVVDIPAESLSAAGVWVDLRSLEGLTPFLRWWRATSTVPSFDGEVFALLMEVTPVRVGRPSLPAVELQLRYALITASRAIALEDSLTTTPANVDRSIEEIADRLVIRLTKDIRIAVVDFHVTRSGSSSGVEYGRPIARMLATRLNASSRLLLLEYAEGDSAIADIFRRGRTLGVVNPNTAAERGRTILANYLVVGDVWQLGDALRLDARCVSVESRATILSRGVTIAPITLEAIDAQLALVAADMLAAIESDFTQHAERLRVIAVVGLHPTPDTGENVALTLSLVRALQRKVATVGHRRLRVREGFEKGELLWSSLTPRWSICTDLGADILAQLHLDRVQRDAPVLDVTLFDAERPGATRSFAVESGMETFDGALEEIVDSLFAEQRAVLEPAERDRARAQRYYGPEDTYWMDLAFGISVRTNPDPYLEGTQGIVVRIAPALVPIPKRPITWEPIGLRADLLGMKHASAGSGRRYVVGFDLFSAAGYRWRVRRTVSPFAGVTLNMISGVVRHVRTETQFEGKAGGGAILGVEIALASGRRVRCRIEVHSTFSPLAGRDLDGERFQGGRIGGAYFTVGSTK